MSVDYQKLFTALKPVIETEFSKLGITDEEAHILKSKFVDKKPLATVISETGFTKEKIDKLSESGEEKLNSLKPFLSSFNINI